MNSNLKMLVVGKKYPFPVREGITAHFLTTGGNVLQICIDHLSKSEKDSFKKGRIYAGFLYEQGDLLWIFQFTDRKGQLTFTFDAPFDARVIPENMFKMFDLETSESRIVIEIHVVDENRIVQVLRSVTMSPELSKTFLEAVAEQIKLPTSNIAMKKWASREVKNLASSVVLEFLGK